MEEVNSYSPFPIYDTERIKLYKKNIKKMTEDLDKVECCDTCKSLFLYIDKHDNTWCGKCNTPNSIEECKDIEDYLEKYGDIWT